MHKTKPMDPYCIINVLNPPGKSIFKAGAHLTRIFEIMEAFTLKKSDRMEQTKDVLRSSRKKQKDMTSRTTKPLKVVSRPWQQHPDGSVE